MINTGVVVTLIGVNNIFKANFKFNFFDALSSSKDGGILTLIHMIFKSNSNIEPKYLDYSKIWYDEIGTKITLTMLIYVFSPHLIKFML